MYNLCFKTKTIKVIRLLKFKSGGLFHLPACDLPIHPLCDCICVYCNTPSPLLSPRSCTSIVRNIYLVMSVPFLHERTHAQSRSLVCMSANLSGCAIVCVCFTPVAPPRAPTARTPHHHHHPSWLPSTNFPLLQPYLSRFNPPPPLLLPSLPTTL